METYKLCVFVFYINTLHCVDMKKRRINWFLVQNIIHCWRRIFNETIRILFTVRHTNKYVYSNMSLYSLPYYVITNIKHLLKLRNIQHSVPSHANRTLNAEKQQI
jgi:hypothetical protein